MGAWDGMGLRFGHQLPAEPSPEAPPSQPVGHGPILQTNSGRNASEHAGHCPWSPGVGGGEGKGVLSEAASVSLGPCVSRTCALSIAPRP